MTLNLPRNRLDNKPSKPHPDFPLTANGNGQWSKKIRGKVYYFGSWADPERALLRYLEVKDDLLAGRKPKSKEGFTIRDLANFFLTAKKRLLDSNEIVERTFNDYHRSCERVLEFLGKTRLVEDLDSGDFGKLREEMSKTMNAVALGNEINRIRVVFNFAYNEGHIDRPVRFGTVFKRPAKRIIRKERQKTGLRMFEADQLRSIVEAAGGQLRAMVYLGINCGFGNTDCATIPLNAMDLEHGWLNFPRPKTSIERRCPLWPETINALQESLQDHSKSIVKTQSELVFITKFGHSWVRTSTSKTGKPVIFDAVSHEFTKLLNKLKLKRSRLSFYALRHTFETIGGESKDQVAVDYIMGHSQNDMAATYRERISNERLIAVTDHIHKWLFGS